MERLVTDESLLRKISEAVADGEAFLRLREYVFDYYYAEVKYRFTSQALEATLDALGRYLMHEEGFGDPQRERKLQRLLRIVQKQGFAAESVILALDLEKISGLVEKLSSGTISENTFAEQIKKLSPVDFNWMKVVSLFRTEDPS